MNDNFKNPLWRLNHLYKIIDKNGDKITFKNNIVQVKLNKSKSKRKIVLKARQQGVSTNELIKMFDNTIWTPNRTNCILAHEQDSIKKLFRIIKRAYDFMDKDIMPQVDRGGGSKYELFFPAHNSRIYTDLESRSDTIHKLHVSEAAFMKDHTKLKATLQAVPIDGEVCIESTPNGLEFFHDMWSDPHSGYEKFFFPWYLFPEYTLSTDQMKIDLTKDERLLCKKAKKLFNITITKGQILFRRFKQSELKELFIQEYPEDDSTCFLSSGQSFFDLVIVKRIKDDLKMPITDDGLIKIFQTYQKGHVYACGADTAEGVGGDYSVGTIYDINTLEQVAEIKGHLKPYDFAHELNDLCSQYQRGNNIWPILAVERNNHGHAVLLELENHIRYINLYRHKDEKLGWLTDKITKPIMLNGFREGLENQTLTINSHDLLSEALTFINNNGKLEASVGKHDDCIIASSIAAQICLLNSSINNNYQNIEKRILL